MNPIKKLISLFKKDAPKLRIRLTVAQLANLDKKSAKYKAIGDVVMVTKSSVLIFVKKKKDRLYFRVKNPFFAPQSIADDGDVVYFTEYRFENSLKYKKL